MAEILRSGDCGNSPKNQLVEDLAVALATADEATLHRTLADDVSRRVVGLDALDGRDRRVATLRRRAIPRVVSIERVLTHGRGGAVNGRIVVGNGRTRELCHVFEFGDARGTVVRGITSYLVHA